MKREEENGLERGDGVEEEINPRDFGGSGLAGVIRGESVGNGACSVVGIDWCQQQWEFHKL